MVKISAINKIKERIVKDKQMKGEWKFSEKSVLKASAEKLWKKLLKSSWKANEK